MPAREVVIVGAARTPIGKYGGSFRDIHPAELGAVAATAVVARGHPIGCTGTRIVVTLLHELERRRQVRRGLATLCVSGGLGMALAIERL
jgi:acetyl-CoA acetyltransferase